MWARMLGSLPANRLSQKFLGFWQFSWQLLLIAVCKSLATLKIKYPSYCSLPFDPWSAASIQDYSQFSAVIEFMWMPSCSLHSRRILQIIRVISIKGTEKSNKGSFDVQYRWNVIIFDGPTARYHSIDLACGPRILEDGFWQPLSITNLKILYSYLLSFVISIFCLRPIDFDQLY